MRTDVYAAGKMNLPRHAANLEVAEMPSILLFSFPRIFRGQELHGGHGLDESVDVMLSKIAAGKEVVTRVLSASGNVHTLADVHSE